MGWPIKKNTDITGIKVTKLELVNENVRIDKTLSDKNRKIARSVILKRFRFGASNKIVKKTLKQLEKDEK